MHPRTLTQLHQNVAQLTPNAGDAARERHQEGRPTAPMRGCAAPNFHQNKITTPVAEGLEATPRNHIHQMLTS